MKNELGNVEEFSENQASNFSEQQREDEEMTEKRPLLGESNGMQMQGPIVLNEDEEDNDMEEEETHEEEEEEASLQNPLGNQFASPEQEDLDAVIESISYGKTQSVRKLQFQAFTAAISHEDQVRFVVDYMNDVNNTTHSKFPTAKNRILAYRVAQLDQVSQREVMAEGFDDDAEDGAGEKLLHLLQKMEIENIVLIVCIWNNGVNIGAVNLKGGEFYRIIVERGRELLNQIQEQIQQEELDRL